MAQDQEVYPHISSVTGSFTTAAVQLQQAQPLPPLYSQDARIHSNQVDLAAHGVYSNAAFWGKCRRARCLRFIWYAPAFFPFLATK